VPSPTGTIGNPNGPCLIGYVWRQAFHGDYVCVPPATRAQAAADDAAANGRIQQGGGAYGPYTCIQGYMWRQVVPDDYTCVLPAVRSQAAYDNSQAANRVALLHMCVQPYSQGLFRYIGIDGYLFNFGPVELEVRQSGTGALVWSGPVTATSIAGLPGGSFYYDTPVLMPSGPDYYIVAVDIASGRLSGQVPVLTACV
jgi:hypothetical protein